MVEAKKAIDLKKLALVQLGSRTNKLLGTSSKINKFLNGNFTVPARISDLNKWHSEQLLGIANKEIIKDITSEAISRDVKKEVSKVAAEIASSVLTKEQEEQVPKAIEQYEKFLTSYVVQLKAVHKLVNPPVAEKKDNVKEMAKELA